MAGLISGYQPTREAAAWFTAVTLHPEAGDALTSAWWELAEANRRLKQWAAAAAACERFRALSPKEADNIPVLLALAEDQIGAGLFLPAKEHLDRILLAEPEGKNNAAARFLLGQWYLAQKAYSDALKAFATLSLIYRDDTLTPRALFKASQAADLTGDRAQAETFRKTLKDQYPAFTEEN